MIERIYCPECDSTEHKRVCDPIKRKNSFTDAVISSIVWACFGLIGTLLFHHGRNNQDVPEAVHYQCQHCGKRFMSPETYQEEIRCARRDMRNGIILALPNAVLLVLTVIVSFLIGLSTPEVYVLIFFLVLFLVVTFCSISTVIKSAKSMKQLTADWNALQEAQVNHIKSAPTAVGNQIPTWKRIQQEQNSNT